MKKRRGEERRGGWRRKVREDGSPEVAAGAISAEAPGTSLDSTEFYWVDLSVWLRQNPL